MVAVLEVQVQSLQTIHPTYCKIRIWIQFVNLVYLFREAAKSYFFNGVPPALELNGRRNVLHSQKFVFSSLARHPPPLLNSTAI